VYEINDGEGIAWQVGSEEIVIPDISWDTLNNLIDPEKPIVDRDNKIATALGGGAAQPPFGGDDGPIIIFPDDPTNLPGDEGEEAYNSGRYFRPSYDGNGWSLDWPALSIMLGQKLQQPVYIDGNPELAKENLDHQVKVRVDNMSVIIDDASLNDQQKQFTNQIPDVIESAGVEPGTANISLSLDDFPNTSNIIFITAENDDQLADRLSQLGEANLLSGKYVVLLTCGSEGLRDFSSWVVQEYGLTGLHVYRNKIDAEILPIVVGELYRLAQEESDQLTPAELLDRSVERILENEFNEDLRQKLERLRNGWDQLSHQFDNHFEGTLVTLRQNDRAWAFHIGSSIVQV